MLGLGNMGLPIGDGIFIIESTSSECMYVDSWVETQVSSKKEMELCIVNKKKAF